MFLTTFWVFEPHYYYTHDKLIKEHNQHNLAQVIGAALDRIGTYNDLDNKQHVIALIDPEMCINCGEPPFPLSSFVLHWSKADVWHLEAKT